MMRMSSLLGAAIICVSSVAQASWTLSNQDSHLTAVSVKKTSVAEVHTFEEISGRISDGGALRVDIDLASVETAIPIRNKRVREMLFETAGFPTATVLGQLDMQAVNKLQPGGRLIVDADFSLALHGHNQSAKAKVMVQRLAGGNLQLTTLEPIIIKAADFGLLEGIGRLKSIAKLPSIATAIPVHAQMIFLAD